jgi:hypothetical protein
MCIFCCPIHTLFIFIFFVNLGDRRRKHNKILGAINNDEVEGSRPYHPEVLTTNFEKEEGAEEGG